MAKRAKKAVEVEEVQPAVEEARPTIEEIVAPEDVERFQEVEAGQAERREEFVKGIVRNPAPMPRAERESGDDKDAFTSEMEAMYEAEKVRKLRDFCLVRVEGGLYRIEAIVKQAPVKAEPKPKPIRKPRYNLEAQVKTLGADSLLPTDKPAKEKIAPAPSDKAKTTRHRHPSGKSMLDLLFEFVSSLPGPITIDKVDIYLQSEGFSAATANPAMSHLLAANKVIREGKGKDRVWKVVK